MASERLSDVLEAEMKRIWAEWEYVLRPAATQANWKQMMRAFARMVELVAKPHVVCSECGSEDVDFSCVECGSLKTERASHKLSLDAVIRRQCGSDSHERVYGEDACMCGAVDYLPSATEKARQ